MSHHRLKQSAIGLILFMLICCHIYAIVTERSNVAADVNLAKSRDRFQMDTKKLLAIGNPLVPTANTDLTENDQRTNSLASKPETDRINEICDGIKIFSEICVEKTKHFTLEQLARLAKTDEFNFLSQNSTAPNRHYFDTYEVVAKSLGRDQKFSILEFGVKNGNSLLFWLRAFDKCRVIGVDVYLRNCESLLYFGMQLRTMHSQLLLYRTGVETKI